jgi:predicted P-loop ATPase
VGKSRRDTNWKNTQVLWPEVVRRLSQTHRTAEKLAEYLAATKSRQDEIKDIGGFVGGYMAGGRRKKGSILHRQLITLDADFATPDLWNDFLLLIGCEACCYSTHKHRPDNPRLRFVIPLDRPVAPDEYEAIARRIAGYLGIDLFDLTTFQAERLMYWPSTAKDAEFVFEHCAGEVLSADAVLDSYTGPGGWRDTTAWVYSSKVQGHVTALAVKQGDPLEKPGVVGAFCRSWHIEDVMDSLLAEAYEATGQEGRYTYKGGSTFGGVVIYDGKFAYSHHSTDPAGGKLCNAFDLVRLHKFGLLDEDAEDGTPIVKRPSYLAMLDYARKDPETSRLIVQERVTDAAADFAGYLGSDAGEEAEDGQDGADIDPRAALRTDPAKLVKLPTFDADWMAKLDVNKKGLINNSIDNVLLILMNDPYFRGRIAFDDFEKCEIALTDLPWRTERTTPQSRRLIDTDDANMRHYLEKTYGITTSTKITDALQILSSRLAFHPVRSYLSGITWDGVDRLDTLLIDYQGAADTPFNRMVTRKFFTAAVARIFQPGCKFDHVLVLVGKQGKAKSALFDKMGGPWYSDSFHSIEGKEAFEQLQGAWVVELAELSALGRAEEEKIKHFITKREDRYRVAYGKRVERFPRQCVFGATHNKPVFLRDNTGGRRYWPVPVYVTDPKHSVYEGLTPDVVGQLWAEAVVRFKAGERIYLTPAEAEMAEAVQRAHTEEHPWMGIVANYLDTPIPESWAKMGIYERRAWLQGENEEDKALMKTRLRTRVCLLELWNEALAKRDTIDARSAEILRGIMQRMDGWQEAEKSIKIPGYGAQRRAYEFVGDPISRGVEDQGSYVDFTYN